MTFVYDVTTDVDPTLPLHVPSLGVDTYNHRFLPRVFGGADGDRVSRLDSVVDGPTVSLTAAGNARPTLRAVGGDRYLEFDGAANVLQNLSLPNYKAAAYVLRGDAAGNAAVANSAGHIVSWNQSQTYYQAFASNAFAASPNGRDRTIWDVFIYSFDAAESIAMAGGVVRTSGQTPNNNLASRLELGKTSAFGMPRIAEVVLFPHALTAAMMTEIDGNLRAQHDELF